MCPVSAMPYVGVAYEHRGNEMVWQDAMSCLKLYTNYIYLQKYRVVVMLYYDLLHTCTKRCRNI